MKGSKSAVDDSETPRHIPTSRRRRIAIAIAALIVLLLAGLWIARVPIATGFIDRKLAAGGVAGRYRIADLGFGRQRLTNVVIGDPAHPDLVADWIETHVDIGPAGPQLAAVRAGNVRLRARLIDGRMSLGAIDRLLPASQPGKPLALPALDLSVADARVRLETPYGLVGLRVAGSGRLDDGFRGTLAAVSDRLSAGGCTLLRPTALVRLSVVKQGPRIAGPVRAAAVHCPEAVARDAAATVDVALSSAFDRWTGQAAVRVAGIETATAQLAALGGRIDFAGDAARTEGRADLASGAFVGPALSGARLGYLGRWRVAGSRTIVAGRVSATNVALDRDMRRRIAAFANSGAGTPLGPIVHAMSAAAVGAATRFDAAGELAIGSGGLLTLRSGDASSASGARLTFGDGAGVVIGDPRGVRIDGVATLGSGGFPQARVALSQETPDAPIEGDATITPYAAGGAQLAIAPAHFISANGGTTIRTAVTLSGPLADGRIERLRLPILARLERNSVTVNPGCAPLAFDRLSAGGLALRSARVTLCPTEGALVRVAGGQVRGRARIAAPRLAGTLGSSPITLAATALEATTGGFAITGLKTRIGAPERQTTLDFARLGGAFGARGIAGRFGGGAGQIGNVPLLIGDAAGDWRFAGGILDALGDATVADASSEPRFNKLAARAVKLRLAGGVITATGMLAQPTKGIKIADVTIRHTLASGTGGAHLAVPGITFGDNLQPEELTRLTFGVIADVKGTVTGDGDIAWTPDRVTSTGTFRTAGTDLAAAFGPVTGIKGEIHFTDLLNLESAPDQVATVASINPGVPVTDGRFVYQTLSGARVKVASGRWPFAGGTLTLEPTLLDFSSPQERRLTFRVEGMEAAQFLQQFDFKNLDASGTFDGVLPMIFDDSGGRIEGGKLTARAGGGGLAYVGDLTEKDLGAWGNIAFQALKSLRYRNLDIVMNGPLAGEMITEVRFAGISQGKGAKSNFLIRRLQKLPFVFNIRIKAPFRGLLDSAASFYDPKRLIERNLPALIEEQKKRAPSETVPARSPTPPPSQDDPLRGGEGERAGAAPRATALGQTIQPPASEKMP